VTRNWVLRTRADKKLLTGVFITVAASVSQCGNVDTVLFLYPPALNYVPHNLVPILLL
jgi:hypothetical protein